MYISLQLDFVAQRGGDARSVYTEVAMLAKV